jgi:hypothetical protein
MALGAYLTRPAGELEIDRRRSDVRRKRALRRLAAIDTIRATTSPLFGHDAHWPVATLARGQPAYRLDWPHPTGHLPAWAFTGMLVLGAGWVLVGRRFPSVLAATVGLVTALMLLTAFSQGFDLRYWLPWSVLLTLAFLIELAAWAGAGRGEVPPE